MCICRQKSSKTLGVTTVIKHHFCCFSNILEKIIQVQGRAQLGINFGSGGSPDCRGLTLEELERIDFSLIDFSEFAQEVQKRMVLPKGGDVEERILGSLSNINRFDEDRPEREENKLAGVNQTLIGPTEGLLQDKAKPPKIFNFIYRKYFLSKSVQNSVSLS